jgi:putative CocE/NonD family hydrolase
MAGLHAEHPRTGARPLWRRVLRWVAIALAALVLIIALLLAVLTFSESAQGWLVRKVITEPILNDRLRGIPFRSEAQAVRLTMVPMRDGVKLSTQVYLPEGKGPWPVLVVRDPYSFSHYGTCKVWVRYDYACVYQEVRGRGPSEGTWYPFVNEREDGLDLLAWIRQQPWQNGKWALTGGSYLGVTQWAVAGDLPPEVKTFVPVVSHGDLYQLTYRNGAFNEGTVGAWLSGQMRSPIGTLLAARNWRNNVAGHFPALGVERDAFGPTWGPYEDYLEHPEKDDPYWQSEAYRALREAHMKVRVPVFMIGYANDIFIPGMLTTYAELPTRAQSLFVIGPGNHGGQAEDEIEGSYTGDYADTLAWFDHHLRGAPLPARLRPGVKVFEHGANRWRSFATWPRVNAPGVQLHLGNLDRAQRCEGGTLTAVPKSPPSVATFRYDPRNPVPTRGGSFELISDAVAEQGTDPCERDDVLSFASAAFPRGITFDGPIVVKLRVASDAADTAFTVKLSEHFADGRVYNIRDDISTLRMRNGATRQMSYRPGQEVELDFNLTPILWRLRPGSRLRLDISSSNSPAFFPHPNRAGLWSKVAHPVIARQTVFSGTLALPLERPPG